MNKDSSQESKLNAIIALLLILVGDAGKNELIKKRRSEPDIVKYLYTLGLSNQDLADIFNTSRDSISHLRLKKQKSKNK